MRVCIGTGRKKYSSLAHFTFLTALVLTLSACTPRSEPLTAPALPPPPVADLSTPEAALKSWWAIVDWREQFNTAVNRAQIEGEPFINVP